MSKILYALIAGLSLLSVTAHSAVIINGTRIIYEESARETAVKITNTGNMPVLLQAWLDNGDPGAKPESIRVPFSLTPPVVRLDAQKGQTIRILRVGNALPADRESVYWFNLLEIPPKATKQLAAGENLMQLAFRTRIKLFYRPEKLPMSVEQAYKHLTFTRKGTQIVVRNASPYYLTLGKLAFRATETGPELTNLNAQKGKMIAPFAELALTLPGKRTLNSGTFVTYTIINDFGGNTPGTQQLD